MALLNAFFLQTLSAAPDIAAVHPPFYTTENLIAVLIGVISLTSGTVIWFVNKAIAAQEKREEKIDAAMLEMKKEIVVLQKDSSIHTYNNSTVDRRLEKLETWKEEMQRHVANGQK